MMSELINNITTGNKIKLTKSEIAERLIILNGRPLSFFHYPFIRAIYDGNYRTTLLKTGRQVSKSTTLANLMLVESTITPYFRTMFVSPTEFQTSYFSDSRLAVSLHESSALRKYLLSGSKVKNNIAVKSFGNGASIVFRYASDNPDRARGFTADRLCYDEIQDMHSSIFEVINECTTMSDYGYKTYAGTPKSMENIIEVYWQESSQNEWLMKCPGCNHWNIPTINNISEKGVICKKCGKLLNVREGRWISTTDKHRAFEGFHIPQIILPWHTENERRWDEILYKRKVLANSTFKNEVMGESDSSGVRWLSKKDLEQCCTNVKMNLHEKVAPQKVKQYVRSRKYSAGIFAGIDWSGGGKGTKMSDGTIKLISRNAITIMGIKEASRGEIIAHKIYTPEVTQPDVVRDMIDMCAFYGVNIVGADAGEGNLGNQLLREALGYHKVLPFRYSGNLTAPAKWNKNAECHILNKSKAIDTIMMAFKRRLINFSNPEECEEIFTDILNEYEETTGHQGGGNKIWTHSPQNPDDSLHSILFAYNAFRAFSGKLGTDYYIHTQN